MTPAQQMYCSLTAQGEDSARAISNTAFALGLDYMTVYGQTTIYRREN